MIVTGIPGAGRSEVVYELLGWLDPKFVAVYGFREPNEVERQRPPLWRYWRVMPPKGRIVILDAGWYGDFLAALFQNIAVPSSSVLEAKVGRDVMLLGFPPEVMEYMYKEYAFVKVADPRRRVWPNGQTLTLTRKPDDDDG